MEWTVQSTLNLIRENLNDRYKSGFPVIQELVQNADDATARQLDIGWTLGLPGAQHPLLRGPAIFVSNDGVFTDRHAQAINSIALSSKSGEQATIGKFGLGLKSVFHLCEAFFYISSNTKFPGAIVNPWADKDEHDAFHVGWDTFSKEDRQAIIDQLQEVLPKARYLCIWIPLRQERHYPGKQPITRNNLGDVLTVPESLQNLDSNLALLLPLLSCLERMQCWMYDVRSQGLERTFRIELEPNAHRRRYPNLDTDRTVLFGGGIEHTNGQAATRKRYLFSGGERLASDPVLTGLKESELWPHSSSTDPETYEYKSYADKADQHCAAYFLRYPAEGDLGGLDIRQAVFLPVGEPIDSLPMVGDWFYQLVLHGYFFVDAGRSRLEGLDHLPNDQTPSDEASLRMMWNSRLAREGTFPLVLDALSHFVEQAQLDDGEIHRVTAHLAESRFFRQYRDQICGRKQWLRCLVAGKPEWRIVPSDEPYFKIPEPHEWTREALPQLGPLATRYRMIASTAPSLTSRPAGRWTAEMLLCVLDASGEVLFGHRERLAYVNDFLELCSGQTTNMPQVSSRLGQLARSGFRNGDLSKLRRYGDEVARFLGHVPAEMKLVFQDRSAVWDSTIQRLLDLDLGVLLVPGGLERETGNADPPVAASITVEDAVRMLQLLAKPGPERTRERAHDLVRSAIALTVLRASQATKPEVLKHCGDLPLFRSQGDAALLSWNDLRRLRDRQTLFRVAPGREHQDLQQALPEERVVQLDKATLDATFGDEAGLTSCNATSCFKALELRPRLAGAVERTPLLRMLQSQVGDPRYRETIRYLLHAQPEDDNGPLYAKNPSDPTSVWAKLLRKTLAQAGRGWSIVSEELASTIASEHWCNLGLALIERKTVVARLQAFDLQRLNCSDLSTDERNTLLIDIDDENLLRRLPIHEDLNGGLVSISPPDSYLETPYLRRVPPELLTGIHIIRRASDSSVAEHQERILSPLNPQATIEIALKQPEPQRYRYVIMDALAQIRSVKWLKADQRNELGERPWLVTRDGRVVAPRNVVHLPELEEEVSRLVAGLDETLVDAGALHADLQAHPGYSVLTAEVLPKPEEALTTLGTILGQDARYGVGRLDDGDRTQLLQALLACFQGAGQDVMPAWGLLKAVNDRCGPDKARDCLLPGLLTDISPQRLAAILGYLSERHERMPARDKQPYLHLHNLCLAVAVREVDFATTILPNIRLLSRTGQWRNPHGLCVDKAGIDDSVILDSTQHKIMQGILAQQRRVVGPVDRSAPANPPPAPSHWLRQLSNSPKILEKYFEEWKDAVNREIIGGFLSLLGDDSGIPQLAARYLGNRHVDETRDLLDWHRVPGQNIEPETVAVAMRLHKFLVQIERATTVRVESLLGSQLEAPLVSHSEMRNLLVGDTSTYFDPGLDPTLRIIHPLVLRQVPASTGEFTATQLSDLLRETARQVLIEFYGQVSPNVDHLWEQLAQSEQLDIRIAQRLILTSSVFYLKQLGVNTDHLFGPILQRWADAQRRQAEEEAATATGRSVKSTGRDQIVVALRELKSLVEHDSQAQAVVLQAVRHKIEHYQYQPESVPFELLQNADDAASELHAALAGESPANHLDRCVLAWDEQRIEFLHWGRPVNEFRVGSLAESEGRERGYDQDLEKMLVLSYSDKQATDGRGPSVTGRFGLGFKSVFLLCDEPEVLSGRLGFKVIGGMYPQRLESETLHALRKQRLNFSGDERTAGRGTLIRLATRDQGAANRSILARFNALVHIMLVFNHQIKHCDLAEAGKPVITTIWNETPVLELGGVHRGSLYPAGGDSGHQTAALVLRSQHGTSKGALLLALGARGFVALSDNVPTIWVTAPTSHERGLGFALNARFDLDVGRAQLARGSERNQALSQEIGREIGEHLAALFMAGHGEDWPRLRAALDLAADATEYDLWTSLWQVVAVPVSRIEVSDCDVLRTTLWGSQPEPAGIGKLITSHPTIPSHLWGEYRCLTRWDDVKRTVQGELEKEEVFLTVAKWPRFRSRHRPGSLVSYRRTYKVLDGLWLNAWALPPLTLGDVVLDETGTERYADPETAERIGGLIDSTLLGKLEREEQETLSSRLREIHFQAQDGRLYPARELLIGSTDAAEFDDREERARAAFAPAQRILADAYTGNALQFLRASRGALSAPARELAEWALLANSERSRRAALVYLLSGQLSAAMAYELRPRLVGSWLQYLNDLKLEQENGFTNPNDRSVILGRLGLVAEISPPPLVLRDPQIELLRMYERWHAEKAEKTARYERLTYPDGQPPVLSGALDPEDPERRKEWLTLLLLGSFHTMGWTRPQQHREFLGLMQRKGWFDVFARPQIVADDWIGVLDEYLQEQQDQLPYYQWVKQFVPIYQLARWLDDYREILLGLCHRQERFALDLVTSPRTSELYQGGGPSGPPLGRVLSIGMNFVLRELVRMDVIASPAAREHCYVPTRGVRTYLMSLGCPIDDSPNPTHSAVIHRFLVRHLGEDRATFDGSFDLPFVMMQGEL